MSISKSCLGVALLLCLSPACIFTSTENDPGDWDIKENNSNNTNNQNNQNNTPGYEPVTLRLLTGQNPAFYEPFFGPAVISITDENGESVPFGPPYCNCMQECPVGAAPAPEPQYIAPQDKVERSWDGSYWVAQPDKQNCAEKKFKPKGAKFFANFCTAPYYYTNDRDNPNNSVFGDGDQSLIECQKVPFFLGEDKLVEKVVDWERKDLNLKVIFENPERSPVKIFVKNQCSPGADAWFKITQDLWLSEDQEIVPGYQCNTQACGSMQEQVCAQADFAPCQESVIVAPGESIEYTWNGWGSVLYQPEACTLYQPAARGRANIKVCYRPGPLNANEPAPDIAEKCDVLELRVAAEDQTITFRPGVR